MPKYYLAYSSIEGVEFVATEKDMVTLRQSFKVAEGFIPLPVDPNVIGVVALEHEDVNKLKMLFLGKAYRKPVVVNDKSLRALAKVHRESKVLKVQRD